MSLHIQIRIKSFVRNRRALSWYVALGKWAVGADPVLLCLKECKQTGGAAQGGLQNTLKRVESRRTVCGGVCQKGVMDIIHQNELTEGEQVPSGTKLFIFLQTGHHLQLKLT